jgi:hypothetical protein
MKKLLNLLLVFSFFGVHAQQINKTELSLKVTEANDKNNKALQSYIWKKNSDVFIDGQLKLNTLVEYKWNDKGEPEATLVDANSTVKDKRGLRGRMQENAADQKMDYVEKAVALSVNYLYMSKGQLIDFFDKATVTEKDGTIEASADNFKVPGDHLTIQFDASTYLYKHKKFNSFLEKDIVEGEVSYANFSNGINHVENILLNLPAQNMQIKSKNQDWTQRVN